MDIRVCMKLPGGPDVLEVIGAVADPPGPGQVRLRHHAIGVSFIDIYHRKGLYPLESPKVPGVEGAGVIEAVGPGVEGLQVGDRAVYAGIPGAYASSRLLPAWRAVPLPSDIPFDIAATSMLRGLTTHMLLTVCHPVRPGSVLLVHAAAGGLGGILTRWAKHLDATVIGTVSSPEKGAIAKANGVDHVIVGRDADIVSETAVLTHGAGVDFVVDGVGGDMLRQSLRCVRPFGDVASIGWVAGPVPPIGIEELGLGTLSKPSVMAYAADSNRYRQAARAVMRALARGVTGEIGGTYRLADAAMAHAELEAGRTTGGLVLLP
ncbi:quinone oxidoreductase [Hyphomonas sp. ND6WE1B]|uniref:quinone oxidoreductase family protein n=1 Tax=Hyphomonas sp. ND6WE1B TaxID=1848191 RepID=UPI0008076386|nr:quinone oxidoreductase [Hyphomonas sp. ND6WE1B]